MAAPDTKISFVKGVGREQRLRVAAEILTVSRNRVAKPSCFRKDRTEGTEKVLSNEFAQAALRLREQYHDRLKR
jgi:hypothetical protein